MPPEVPARAKTAPAPSRTNRRVAGVRAGAAPPAALTEATAEPTEVRGAGRKRAGKSARKVRPDDPPPKSCTPIRGSTGPPRRRCRSSFRPASLRSPRRRRKVTVSFMRSSSTAIGFKPTSILGRRGSTRVVGSTGPPNSVRNCRRHCADLRSRMRSSTAS